MPRMEVVSVDEAMRTTATGRRAETLQEYLGYIGRLKGGHAGRLTPAEGETVAAVRRRLGAAAKALGKNVAVRRAGNEVYFWVEAKPRKRRRRQA